MKQIFFKLQNNLVLTSKDEEVSRTDTSLLSDGLLRVASKR